MLRAIIFNMETSTQQTSFTSGPVFIDSMEYVKRLEAKGYTQEQAEEQISVLLDIMNTNLASKADLNELETKLNENVNSVKIDMIKWMFTLFIAQMGMMLAILMKLSS